MTQDVGKTQVSDCTSSTVTGKNAESHVKKNQ